MVLGITGGIACGKSEVGRILSEMDFCICDADQVAHELMEKGKPVYRQVVDQFGEEILTGDGEISRRLLGERVFADPAQRRILNRLVHPAVKCELTAWIHARRNAHENAAALIPLLFESGMESLDWNAVWTVSAVEEVVLERLKERGLNRQEALQRMRAQMTRAEKEDFADEVILNNGSLKELEVAVRKAVEAVKR